MHRAEDRFLQWFAEWRPAPVRAPSKCRGATASVYHNRAHPAWCASVPECRWPPRTQSRFPAPKRLPNPGKRCALSVILPVVLFKIKSYIISNDYSRWEEYSGSIINCPITVAAMHCGKWLRQSANPPATTKHKGRRFAGLRPFRDGNAFRK